MVSSFSAVTFLLRPFLLYSAAACLGLLGGTRVRAQVAETSPFLPAGSASGPNGVGENLALELRGIMTTPDGTRFCIYDPVKKSGIWTGLNERGHAFVVKSADLAHDTVMVQSEGHTLKLALHQARIAALGPTGSPGGVAPPAEGAATPSPADQAQRLAAVAEEVRRRRELRNQQAQQGGEAAPAAGRRQPPPQ
jgi:hypothetical protein